MKTLIKGALICYPGHAYHGKRISVLLDDGKVVEMGADVKAAGATLIEGEALMLFPAFADMQCSAGDPGFEHKETLDSVALAAKSGGFSTIVILPSTQPPVDNAATLRSVQARSKSLPVQLLFYGSISKGLAGKELAELGDMRAHGAVAFTDGKHPVRSAGLMKLALEYARGLDSMVCSLPYDEDLVPGAQVHESPHNTALGLKSAPRLAEEITLQRDLNLLSYTGSRLHIATVSSSSVLQHIKTAKENGLKVSCGVALANLLYNDHSLGSFDTDYKTMPHLREESDRLALIEALKNGTIDVIVTDHLPEDVESKDTEFDHAASGMTMLETALSLINEHVVPALSWDDVVRAMAIRPRQILGLDLPLLQKGAPFECVVFDPQMTWTYDDASRKSKSANSPLAGKTLKGKVVL